MIAAEAHESLEARDIWEGDNMSDKSSVESAPVDTVVSRMCQCCKSSAGVESISIFGTAFTVCAYCRGDALYVLQMSYTWERASYKDQDEDEGHGHAIVFDGGREIYRRGYGLRDHG